MDSPGNKCTAPNTNREYFALLSYLPLNKYRAIPAFFKFTFQKQLRSTPGIIGYALHAKPWSRNFWTFSACTDEKQLMDFVGKIPHRQAMKAMMRHRGPTKFTKWEIMGSAVPLRWEEAMARSKKGEAS